MTTRFETCKEAIAQLERAVAELDQARASMKDIGLYHLHVLSETRVIASLYNSGPMQWRRPTISQIVADVEGLLGELRDAECDDCGHLLSKHGDRYGCEYERGDVETACRDGGTILAAAGPCGCEWGLKEARS